MAVRLTVGAPRPQRRWTVALRLVLAMPHLLFGTIVLGTVAFAVIVVAWFAALLTARVPYGIADLVARILQFQARMYGYGQLLLTDVYPPFDVGPADHPIELDFDEVGELNRLAVLFRAVLLLPAMIVVQLLVSGVTIAMLVLWLVTLVTGRMPAAAHEAVASSLQYQMRTYAYAGLVTTTYPGGLFTDVSRSAKRVLVVLLVLGTGAQGVNVATTVASVSRGLSAARELDEHYVDLLDATDTWDEQVGACELDECVRAANTTYGIAVDRFRQHVRTVDASEAAEDEIDAVSESLEELRGLLDDTDDPERLRLAVDDTMFVLDDQYAELYEEVLAG